MPEPLTLVEQLHDSSPAAAAIVVPMMIELCDPTSVLDVGCGIGAWLAEFAAQGITDLHGIDIFEQSTASMIPAAQFEHADLSDGFTVERGYDLAICLEVGEHLPSTSAPALVTSLVAAAPVVAFSAAIPGQDGPGHVNMQWPMYWRELFETHGYRQYDPFRARLWDDARVPWWYAQNTFVYSVLEFDAPLTMPEQVVHPRLFADRLAETDPRTHSLREVIGALPAAARTTLRHRLRRFR